MSRGNWSYIVALGWLILCGAHPPQEKTKGAESTQQVAPAVAAPTPLVTASPTRDFAAYPGYNPDPCYQANDHNAADLCAQWRSAIAAEKAAHEARRATNWSIIATLLGASTVIGLIITIYQTHGALGEARRGNILAMRENARATRRASAAAKETAEALAAANMSAGAANRHAKVAEESTLVQLRSYLIVDRIEVFGIPAQSDIHIEIVIKNVGMTPARVKQVRVLLWGGAMTISPMDDGPEPESYYHLLDWFPQATEDRILVGCKDVSAISKMNEVEQFNAYAYGRIEYVDVFGHDRWMTFAYRNRGWGVTKDTEFTPCIHGNDGN